MIFPASTPPHGTCSTTATVRSPSSMRTANVRRFLCRLTSAALMTSSAPTLLGAEMIDHDPGADGDLARLQQGSTSPPKQVGDGDEIRRRRDRRHARHRAPTVSFGPTMTRVTSSISGLGRAGRGNVGRSHQHSWTTLGNSQLTSHPPTAGIPACSRFSISLGSYRQRLCWRHKSPNSGGNRQRLLRNPQRLAVRTALVMPARVSCCGVALDRRVHLARPARLRRKSGGLPAYRHEIRARRRCPRAQA